jgi:hypothetical protein
MRAARRWAKAAIIIGLFGGLISTCLGVAEGALTGLASGGGDCGGGCTARHEAAMSHANALIALGLIGGTVLVLGGIFLLRYFRPDPEAPAEVSATALPPARVVDSNPR